MVELPGEPPPLLEMRHIDKSFPGVRAVRDVSLALQRGEVLGIVGENGAGKSTLIKVLGGAHRPDRGHILLDGQPVVLGHPRAAEQAGIAIIYQEFNLVPDLSVRENLYLGREQTWAGLVRARQERRQAAEVFRKLGVQLDPEARCRALTVAQQQVVEIAKAMTADARLIVMDEPTAALNAQEVTRLLAVIRELLARGMGVIYISHRLDEIFAVTDRVLVLRDGCPIATEATAALSRRRLIELMVGRPLEAEFPKQPAARGPARLRVEALSRGRAVQNVTWQVHAGEVLGLAGLAGAGRTETARLVFGADRPDAGRIFVDGRLVRIRDPRDAIRHRICLLPEDRKTQGLVLSHSVRHNFALPNLRRLARGPFLRQGRERAELARYIAELRIRVSDPEQLAATLSGGNQQKVVLAKWLATQADIVIFDEPTRGIDVGAKYEIYQLMNRLAADGKAVVMISSELPELLGMSDRIVVMHEGMVKGEITDVAAATQESILAMAYA